MPGFYEIQTRTGWGRTLAAFAEWCRPQSGWRTLDVGCGPGLLPHWLAQMGCQSFGVDLDPASFQPAKLHPWVAAASGASLPFTSGLFHLVTASNLLFLLPQPEPVLLEMKRVLLPSGRLAILNPSENLTPATAQALADQRGLQGVARQTLLNWANLAESHQRWSEAELIALFAAVGLRMVDTTLKIGPGLARLALAAY